MRLTGGNQGEGAVRPFGKNSLKVGRQLIGNDSMCSHVWVSVTPVACVKISAGQLQKLDVGEALHLCSDIQASHVLHVVSGQVVGACWDRLQRVSQNDDLWGAVHFVDLQDRTPNKGHFTPPVTPHHPPQE